MPITPGEGEFWKEYRGQLKKAMDYISDYGESSVTRNELKRIANPIIREAKKRMRKLEMAGYTDSPAYRYIKKHKIEFTAAGLNLNAIRHSIREAYTFLLAKTSTVEGTRQFIDSTINRWLGIKTTREQREAIWDLYTRLEDIHPGWFAKETYGSTELEQDIYDIYRFLDKSNFDIDVALENIRKSAEPDLFSEIGWEEMASMRWSGRL